MLPRTERYVPSSIQRAPLRQYPATRHFLKRFASPSQDCIGRLNRCMYFLSCARIDTARDNALKDSACVRHHEDERPYLLNALYAGRTVQQKDGNDAGRLLRTVQ